MELVPENYRCMIYDKVNGLSGKCQNLTMSGYDNDCDQKKWSQSISEPWTEAGTSCFDLKVWSLSATVTSVNFSSSLHKRQLTTILEQSEPAKECERDKNDDDKEAIYGYDQWLQGAVTNSETNTVIQQVPSDNFIHLHCPTPSSRSIMKQERNVRALAFKRTLHFRKVACCSI